MRPAVASCRRSRNKGRVSYTRARGGSIGRGNENLDSLLKPHRRFQTSAKMQIFASHCPLKAALVETAIDDCVVFLRSYKGAWDCSQPPRPHPPRPLPERAPRAPSFVPSILPWHPGGPHFCSKPVLAPHRAGGVGTLRSGFFSRSVFACGGHGASAILRLRSSLWGRSILGSLIEELRRHPSEQVIDDRLGVRESADSW